MAVTINAEREISAQGYHEALQLSTALGNAVLSGSMEGSMDATCIFAQAAYHGPSVVEMQTTSGQRQRLTDCVQLVNDCTEWLRSASQRLHRMTAFGCR